jgi:hypothetical protein
VIADIAVVVIVTVLDPIGVAVKSTHVSHLRELEGDDQQLLTADHLHVGVVADPAEQDGRLKDGRGLATVALDGHGHVLDVEQAAFEIASRRQHLPGPHERIRHDLTKVTDTHQHPRHRATMGVAGDGLGDRLA